MNTGTIKYYQIGRSRAYYEVAAKGAQWQSGFSIGYPEFITATYPAEWHKMTGIKLRKGEVKQVKITHLENGFKFEVCK